VTVRDLLERGLDELSVSFTGEQIDKLLFHISEIERWNARFNLVRAGGSKLAIRHVLDSLSGLRVIAGLGARGVILDAGSGAGFPGIPLAIFMRESKFALAERREKRAVFLENAVLLLGLGNARVENADYRSLPETFDVITFRAFSLLPQEMRDLVPKLSRGGCVVAYKGTKRNADAEADAVRRLGYSAETLPVKVPFLDEERNIVIVRSPGGM
jgi:16S rRNA (guanine527-N7)-methyltransferase